MLIGYAFEHLLILINGINVQEIKFYFFVYIFIEADSSESDELFQKITQCVHRLNEYNTLLEDEVAKRNQLATQMKAFYMHLCARITETQNDLKVYIFQYFNKTYLVF